MKRHITLLIFLVFLCGCIGTTPSRSSYSYNRSDRSISQMVDDKVAKELPKALSSIIGQNVIDYGPYGISALLVLLLGKKHIDLRKAIKK